MNHRGLSCVPGCCSIDTEVLDPDLESYWWLAQLYSRSSFTLDYMLEWLDRIHRRKQ